MKLVKKEIYLLKCSNSDEYEYDNFILCSFDTREEAELICDLLVKERNEYIENVGGVYSTMSLIEKDKIFKTFSTLPEFFKDSFWCEEANEFTISDLTHFSIGE